MNLSNFIPKNLLEFVIIATILARDISKLKRGFRLNDFERLAIPSLRENVKIPVFVIFGVVIFYLVISAIHLASVV